MIMKRLIYILFMLICATVSAKDYIKDAELATLEVHYRDVL